MRATFSTDKTTLVVVIFARAKDDMDKAFNGDVAAALNGATVSVTGEVQDYKGRPEIVVDHTDQITIQQAATTEPSATTQP
jgi:DNA/RNA endonuclease YhcR with UshA esterase domain